MKTYFVLQYYERGFLSTQTETIEATPGLIALFPKYLPTLLEYFKKNIKDEVISFKSISLTINF